ncbi:non-structural maintenance of chromosomes element 4 homolog A-like [Argiope bruennichi]|uniref:Non-structural maintenance of chromosomes element 4 n=1 Tax=Argiope bruennichi TaxID=94029 RepID=A0A8T0F673_ARGBR|nr:non-structural maintenance of chromosomes element 4 homolog A-like [Argiope bruennichi]KAF8786696.1 Non-structural maintenance of chromosomes like protein [Argiope bruennichi]
MDDKYIIQETKKLRLDLLEHEEEFISGARDLNRTLDRTEELYREAISSTEATASRIIQDSGLLELQTRIARHCAKAYTVDTLVFNPREFSIKVRNYYCPRFVDQDKTPKRTEPLHKVWDKLGDLSKRLMFTVPNFSFLYGTFDADPIEAPKKQRKVAAKDKIGEQTKPEKVNPNAASKQQDVMLASAERILAIFQKLAKKNKTDVLCFYEFVTDPQSFTRTIENIFLVSLLVKEGYLSIFLDEQKLPYLKLISRSEKERWNTSQGQQTILSLTMEEWQDIIQTFNFETPLIPPKQTQAET